MDAGSSGSGGYYRYLRNLVAPGRVPAGVEVAVLCSPRVAAALGRPDDRVELHVEPLLADPARWRRARWWLASYPALVRRLAPDAVLHLSGVRRGAAGKVPRVVVHHNMAPFDGETLRQYRLSPIGRQLLAVRARLTWSFRHADGVVFHTAWTRDAVVRQVGRVKRTAIAPNGVEPQFRAAAPRGGPLHDPPEILCVSTLFLYKYQWNLVAAVARLRERLGLDLRLTLVGSGEPLATARVTGAIGAHAAAGWARLVPTVPLDQMAATYRAADLFVFPSAVETWPITLLEAMAAGLPIACSNRMVMPEVLGDGGVYFDPRDPDSIATALGVLLVEPEVRRRCAARAHAAAAAYTWERTAAAVYGFLASVGRQAVHA